MENQENLVLQQMQEAEMKCGQLITGTMDSFEWTPQFDISEYKNVSNFVLKLDFEDIKRTDIVKCGLYRDKNDGMCVLIQCSAEELNSQHINHMIPMLLTSLRDETALNDDVIEEANMESFENIYDLIDAVGKLHLFANVVSQ